jgi:hypothetical protein
VSAKGEVSLAMSGSPTAPLCALLLIMLSPGASGPEASAQAAKIACQSDGSLVRVAELPEASGIAASRQQKGKAWAHNDSGEAALVALDEQGRPVGRIRISGAEVEDWEAIAAGPCPSGSCLYIGDIGDNNAERERITIYRVAEPRDGRTETSADETLHGSYPDGRHDAETLLVTPEGEMFIVTKGETGPTALYRFPRPKQPGSPVGLVAVGKPRGLKSSREERITDGAVSPDGRWIALRSIRYLFLYPAADLLSGNWREAARIDLVSFGEEQGEGVTFADNRTLILVGEGGGKSRRGTFIRLSCSF